MADRYHGSCASVEVNRINLRYISPTLDELRRIESTSLRDTFKFDLNFAAARCAMSARFISWWFNCQVSNLRTCEQVRSSIDSRFTRSTYSFAFALRTEYICFSRQRAAISAYEYCYSLSVFIFIFLSKDF